MQNPSHLLRPIALAMTLGLASLGSPAQGVPASTPAGQVQALDIPALPAPQALQRLIEATQLQLIYSPDLMRGVTTRAVKGSFTPKDALARMLEDSGLQAIETGLNAATIRPKNPSAEHNEAGGDAVKALDTVLVSAMRRREPVREVPMQVNVVSADHLDRAGAKTLQDYLGNEPGVDVKSTGGPGIGTLAIRGVSTGAQTISTVGVYIDEVAFGSSTAVANGAQMALDMGLLDLDHLELLRGPQGTLYGASAMGGLLKYVTREPDAGEFSGKASLSIAGTRGGGLSHTLGAVINAPLKEDVAGLRVSAFTNHAGGSVDAVGPVTRSDNDRGDTTGARASLLLTPTAKLKLRFTGLTQKIRRDGTDFVDYDASTGRPIEGDGRRRLYAAEPYDVKISLLSSDVEYDMGWARLNWILSRQWVDSTAVTDMSAGFVPLLGSMGLSVASTPARVSVSLDKTTQEFRLTSRTDRQFEWLLGFYYDRENSSNRQRAATVLPDGTAGPDLLTAEVPASYRETAAYGDLTWKFSRNLSVTGGLRIAKNRQHYTQTTGGLLVASGPPIVASSSDSSRTWLLTARYNLDATSSVYARAASGYRPGGPNAVLRDPVTGNPQGPLNFQPDTLTSYELGYKADLLDKRLSIEAAAYRLDWKDIQQYLSINGVATVVNAGAAKVQGAELTLAWRPDEHWVLSGNAAWIDAKLTEDAPGLEATAGARLPVSARFAASLNANYTFRLGDRPSYVGASFRYVGNRTSGFPGSTGSPLYVMPAYSITDLQAGIEFQHFSLALFARNVFDKRAQQGALDTINALGGPMWVSQSLPRTVGATLTLPF